MASFWYKQHAALCRCVVILTACFCSTCAWAVVDPVDWVNSYIGTGSGPIGYGGTMPFVTEPFGMTNWTPQTRQNSVGTVSYNYADAAISGLMATHQPAIWMGDYGYLTLMPEAGSLKISPNERQLRFSHADETAHPYGYSVWLQTAEGQRIRAEMTATARCGYLRFTFPKGLAPRILIEASRQGSEGSASFDPVTAELTGFNADRMDRNLGPLQLPHFRSYFVVRFRTAYARGKTYGTDEATAAGPRGAYAEFAPSATNVIEVQVGTSFISVEQARANLNHELPAWNFDQTGDRLRALWDAKLSLLSVDGANPAQRRILYTCLYHALLYPRRFSEDGRYYSAFDDRIHSGESYTDYSIWDTFRAENSMLTLVAPERINGMIQALLQDYAEGGWMPKWPNPSYTNIMIATHADSLVAEAILKGFHGFSYQTAWDAVLKDATVPPDGDTTRRWFDREPHTPYEARAGLTYSKALGYIPVDKTAEAASSTLEDAYDDWCVAQVARALHKDADFQFFMKRSQAYNHLFNPVTGLMQGKLSNGAWADSKEGWTEGNAWVYTWAVMQDMGGLLELMGGRDNFNRKLDEHFSGGHNVHSNEPSHHYGYLYDFSGEPWKTQAKVREIASAEYADGPAGLDGDDDCGQMSAWYLFTAFGLYPVNPASGNYMIGSPMFSRMSLRLANGKTFSVTAENNSAQNVYIQSARLDGRPLSRPFVTYKEMMQGASLVFVMGPKPSNWSAAWSPKPLSVSKHANGRK